MPHTALNLAAFAERKAVSVPAHIYFTLDYRQVVEGDLRPGAKCHLRYDPLRMPAPEGYAFGSPDEPIVAHVLFHEGGEVHDFPLHSKSGILRDLDVDITGHGTTLDTSFPVPDDAQKLIIWFSHQRQDGQIAYDSQQGANYEFRFTYREIRLVSAGLARAEGGATNTLSVSVAAAPMVEAVEIVYHTAEQGVVGPEKRAALQDTGTREGRDHLWAATLEVSFDRVVVLDISYRVGDHTTVDDNNHHHYLIFPPKE